MNEENLVREPVRVPLRVGLIGTATWGALAGVYIASHLVEIATLEPDAMGNFLAGFFAPLAFLWLVVGYLQQSQELTLQVRELAHQVEATRELAISAAQQAEIDRTRLEQEQARMAPAFVISGFSMPEDELEVSLRNRGGPAQRVEVGGIGVAQLDRINWLDSGELISVRWLNYSKDVEARAQIHYSDSVGRMNLTLRIPPNGNPILDEPKRIAGA